MLLTLLRAAGLAAVVTFVGLFHGAAAPAADFASTQQLYYSGDYERCLQLADEEVGRGIWNDRWWRLLVQCQLTTGRYDEARQTYEAALKRYGSNIQLRLMGREVYLFNGEPQAARRELELLLDNARQATWRYTSAEDLVTLGRCFLLQGEDARQVLELFFDRARKLEPQQVESYIATADLALRKHDYALAAQMADQAAKLAPERPDIAWLQAEAWLGSDAEKATAALNRALELNPRHVPSLLMQAERLIDMEQFDQAEERLTRVLEVNLFQPEAWALHAVIAHLEGKYQAEGMLRQAALCRWKTNADVDHVIGRKLSRHYRFAEGVQYQRRALTIDPDHAGARFQLAQDLLRLGRDEEGWELADQAFDEDAYNVVAHNLVKLHEHLKQFRTLESDGLIVRMDAREAQVYGRQVLELLHEARRELCAKYDVQLEGPVTVEIFPQQGDFAIRTFGLPGGAGFLGVCFGRVITANSPASQGTTPANWQAVLWHEFCHVVTLEKTQNKMPRWLSEGISVYEERQKDPTWGQGLTPQYRRMLLGDELTPVSRLSGAFLRPPSPLHLQFAYYQSSLVVEYLIEQYGLDVLKRILVDLGVGMPINDALQRYVGSIELLDREFTRFARERAGELGPQLDWERDELPERGSVEVWRAWLEERPDNYWGLRAYADALRAERQWQEAAEVLQRLSAAAPQDSGVQQALAAVYRQTGEVRAEREALERHAALENDAVGTYQRLMELFEEEENWESVARYGRRLLAVNPLLPEVQQVMARAAEKLGQDELAVDSLEALSLMDPADPAGLHYRLGAALARLGRRQEARRHVLQALEEAPRYRDAHKLLLQLVAKAESAASEESADSDDSEDSESPERREETERAEEPQDK